jgi:hypothetical protein
MARFLLATLGITAMYVGLQQVWLSLSPLAEMYESRAERVWPEEAATVASAARDADRQLPPEWRVGAFRLGYHVGYLTERVGGFAMSDAQVRTKVREITAPLLKSADDLARAMGVEPVAVLPVSTADEFARVDERLEQDELGLAKRMEDKASLRHRHLLMLGMHLGVTVAAGESTYGELLVPKRRFIGHHATLAAVPAAAWEPVTRAPDGATPQDRLASYMASLAELERAIAQLPPLP